MNLFARQALILTCLVPGGSGTPAAPAAARAENQILRVQRKMDRTMCSGFRVEGFVVSGLLAGKGGEG